MTAPEFSFTRHGRSNRAAFALIATYVLIALAMALFDAAWWLMAIIALFTLPALWDYWRDTTAGLSLGEVQLTWYSGTRRGHLDLDEIDFMRFDTRWDLSVRVSAVLKTGKRIRLPYESLPPHKILERECEARHVRVERHHFTVF